MRHLFIALLLSSPVCFADWGLINGTSINGANNADSIVFTPRGWLANPSSDFNTNGYIELNFFNQEANRNQRTDYISVQLSRAGMIRLVSYEAAYPSNSVGVSSSSTVQ